MSAQRGTGTPHGGDESAESLRELAGRLETAARALSDLASRMDAQPGAVVRVLHSRGLRAAIDRKILPFIGDAANKISRAGM